MGQETEILKNDVKNWLAWHGRQLSFKSFMAEFARDWAFRILVKYQDIPIRRGGKVLKRLIPFTSKYNTFIVTKKIGRNLRMMHPFSSIINAESIGDNFIFYQNVTIGTNRDSNRPRIGNNVIVNAHSVIIGDITIGDNVWIGACSFVSKSVPSDTMVVGNPAKAVKRYNPSTKTWEKLTSHIPL